MVSVEALSCDHLQAAQEAAGCSKRFVLRKWLKALFAVLLGNLIYFAVLMPRLPAAGQHRPNRLDLGLAIDFWVCVGCYGLINLMGRKSKGSVHRLS